MAKRKRYTGSDVGMSKKEAEEIAKGVTTETPKSTKKSTAPSMDEKSKAFSLRIPIQLYERLLAQSEKYGYPKSSIINRGLDRELREMEDRD